MNSETPSKDKISDKSERSRTLWFWIGGSAVGALVGAGLALILFPIVGLGGRNLVGFALAIGIAFGISQWLVLRYVPRYREEANTSWLVLWIPVTSIGVAAMILPLWWWPAEQSFWQPWLVVLPMLPGMIFLGLVQWFLLYRVISASFIWVVLTIVGAAVGSILGLVAASFPLPFPGEATWAFVTGAGIGVLQGIALVSDLDVDLRR